MSDRGRSILLVLLAGALLGAHGRPILAQEGSRAASIAREVERMARTRTYWPGFDPLVIPLVIFTGSQTYLTRHPAPPAGFHPVPGSDPALFVLEGRHAAATANSSADIGGTVSATILADGARQQLAPSALAATALHEAFHVFQRARHPGWSGNEGDVFLYPTSDARVLALRRLETLTLDRSARASDSAATACWARAMLDYRRRRFAAMDSAFARYDRLTELNEGLATWVQLVASGRTSVDIPPAEFRPEEFRDRIYVTGPALGFVLDRLRPGWPAMLETNDSMSLDDVLGSALGSDGTRCALEPGVVAQIERTAASDADAVVASRTTRRQVFDRRPGWRVVVHAMEGQPLWPQGFDPLNVGRVDGGFLHTRFLRLGNDAGEVSVIDEAEVDIDALTVAAGAHPLFNGIRSVTVAGLGKPDTVRSDSGVTVHAPGFAARFARATWDITGTTLVIRLLPKP